MLTDFAYRLKVSRQALYRLLSWLCWKNQKCLAWGCAKPILISSVFSSAELDGVLVWKGANCFRTWNNKPKIFFLEVWKRYLLITGNDWGFLFGYFSSASPKSVKLYRHIWHVVHLWKAWSQWSGCHKSRLHMQEFTGLWQCLSTSDLSHGRCSVVYNRASTGSARANKRTTSSLKSTSTVAVSRWPDVRDKRV